MIRLSFNNPNARSLTTISIYRSELAVPIPDIPTEPPLVVLDGFSKEYIDYTTVVGVDYNYRFKVARSDEDYTMSANIVLGDVSRDGPGDNAYPIASFGINGENVNVYGPIFDDGVYLPSTDTLLEMAGTGSNLRGWNTRWRKAFIANDVYFYPDGGYIKLPVGNWATLIARMRTGPDINCLYMTYTANFELSSMIQSAMLDGKSTGAGVRNPMHLKQNLQQGIVGRIELTPNMYVFTGLSMFSDSIYYSAPIISETNIVSSSTIYRVTQPVLPETAEIYWIPIFKFVRKTKRNAL